MPRPTAFELPSAAVDTLDSLDHLCPGAPLPKLCRQNRGLGQPLASQGFERRCVLRVQRPNSCVPMINSVPFVVQRLVALQYEEGSAPALALDATIQRTNQRFASYASKGVLCGTDGLPHLIADPGLALKYGHAGEIFVRAPPYLQPLLPAFCDADGLCPRRQDLLLCHLAMVGVAAMAAACVTNTPSPASVEPAWPKRARLHADPHNWVPVHCRLHWPHRPHVP